MVTYPIGTISEQLACRRNMLGVTLFGIFLTPVFFYIIQGIGDWRSPLKPSGGESP